MLARNITQKFRKLVPIRRKTIKWEAFQKVRSDPWDIIARTISNGIIMVGNVTIFDDKVKKRVR